MQKQIITGMCDMQKNDGGNSFYILNGDIETDKDNDLIYIVGYGDGTEKSRKIKEMPKFLHEYILNNMKMIEI